MGWDELKLTDWYLLTKLDRLVIPLACFVLGLFISSDFGLIKLLPIIPIILIYAASAALNDIFDLKIDTVSNPERPLPSRKLDSSGAYFIILSLIILGILSTFLIGLYFNKPYFVAFGLIEIILGVVYSTITSKHFISATATLATSHGLLIFLSATYLFGNIFGHNTILLGSTIWSALFLAYNIKDFKDFKGDIGNRATLPTLFGINAGKQMMKLLFIALLPITIAVNFLLEFSIVRLILSLAFSGSLIYLGDMLVKTEDQEGFIKILNVFRYVMAGYLLSFLF